VNFWGGSEAVGPNGEVTARGNILDEDFVLAEIEEGALRRERIFSPLMRDESISITLRELQRIENERGRLCRSLR
jgi:NAD+ synthase (glutamine-hydrolysing)